jgi:hypothetical protein
MVNIVIDAVLLPSVFAFMNGIVFAGTLANLGSLNSSGANRTPPTNFDGETSDQAAMWADFFCEP